MRDAFAFLLETGAVKRGQHESATENLRVVLDYLQTEKADNYKQKIESKRGPKSLILQREISQRKYFQKNVLINSDSFNYSCWHCFKKSVSAQSL